MIWIIVPMRKCFVTLEVVDAMPATQFVLLDRPGKKRNSSLPAFAILYHSKLCVNVFACKLAISVLLLMMDELCEVT